MKTIIISDIEGHKGSILPYALRWARAHESEADIVHTIDPRKHQGTSSSLSDSQSITPGDKLSHERILQREKNSAGLALQKFISGEGSRLNYPLKINVLIEEGTLKEAIAELENKYPGSVFLASTDPVNSMVDGLDELLETTRSLRSLVLFIPPDHPYKAPKKAMMFTDFNTGALPAFEAVDQWLRPFDVKIHAFGLSNGMDQLDMEMRSAAWLKIIKENTDLSADLATNVVEGREDLEDAFGILVESGADVGFFPGQIMEGDKKKPVPSRKLQALLESTEIPVAIY